MKTPPITTAQATILSLIYRYRFMERQHVQTWLRHKDTRRVSSWLKDLREKHYVEWVYNSNDFVGRLQPAQYYLGINGIRYLQSAGQCPPSELRKRYRDRDRSVGFRARCVLLNEACIEFRAKNSQTVRYEAYTQAELADDNHEFHFLHEFGPHLVFVKQEGGATTHYMLEIFDATLPRYRMRNRLNKYITFLTEGDWQYDDATPVVLLVCPTTADLIYIKRRTRRLLADTWETNAINIRVTTAEKLKEQGVLGEVWENI